MSPSKPPARVVTCRNYKPCTAYSLLLLFIAARQPTLAQTVITLAGGSTTGNAGGSVNGIGLAALFNNPTGVSVDGVGNVYVADRSNQKIRLIYTNQSTITHAGGNMTGISGGSINGVGTAALFLNPYRVSVDGIGNVFVADTNNHKIRLISPNQTVITLAGGSTTGTLSGSNNGAGTAALFNGPYGISVNKMGGNIYVADRSNHKVRLIYPNLTVVTFAGGGATGTASGSTDGVGTAALFQTLYDVSVDGLGNVFVADFANHKIRLIYPSRAVITLFGRQRYGHCFRLN